MCEASSAEFDGVHDQTNPLNETSAALPKYVSMTTFFAEEANKILWWLRNTIRASFCCF